MVDTVSASLGQGFIKLGQFASVARSFCYPLAGEHQTALV